MKMKRKLLPTVSVFFCILILASCGIATLFFVSYSFTPGSDTGDSVSGSFFVSSDTYNNLDLVKTGTGPSLMLFYVLSNSKTIPYSSISNTFSTNYKKSPYGRIVTTSVSDPIVLTYTDSSGASFNLFAFSDTDRKLFSAPQYILSADVPSANNLEFSLSRSGNTASGYEIIPIRDAGAYTFQTAGNLRRFNGTQFSSDTEDIQDATVDYDTVDTSLIQDATYYCHVFGAMCVSQGDFNNIFWTNLTYLGHLDFPTITT